MLAIAMRPLGVAVFLGITYGFLRLLWRFVPNGRIKQILFFRLWGKDNDPWNRPGAWEKAGPIGRPRKDARTQRVESTFLPPHQSQAADPDSTPPQQ